MSTRDRDYCQSNDEGMNDADYAKHVEYWEKVKHREQNLSEYLKAGVEEGEYLSLPTPNNSTESHVETKTYIKPVLYSNYSESLLTIALDTIYDSRYMICSILAIIFGILLLAIIPFWINLSIVSLGFCGYSIYMSLESHKKYGSEAINTGIWGILVAISLALPVCLTLINLFN